MGSKTVSAELIAEPDSCIDDGASALPNEPDAGGVKASGELAALVWGSLPPVAVKLFVGGEVDLILFTSKDKVVVDAAGVVCLGLKNPFSVLWAAPPSLALLPDLTSFVFVLLSVLLVWDGGSAALFRGGFVSDCVVAF